MKINNIKKVSDCFVGEDCIQHTFDYKNKILILDLENIIYKDFKDESSIINKYISDERKKEFPYHEIPVYRGKKGLFGKINYVNELLDFNKKYVCIKPGMVKVMCAFTANGNVYLIEDEAISTNEKKRKIITKHEMFNYYTNEIFVSINEKIVSYGINIRLKKKLDDDEFTKFSNIIQIHNHNNDLELYRVDVEYLGNDLFQIKKEKLNYNIDKSLLSYISMYIKYNEKSFNYDVGEISHPNINLKYNPNITSLEIEKAKQHIKKK